MSAQPEPIGLARTFLVECYAPGIEEPAVLAAGERARAAAIAERRDGETLEYLGALFVAGDEVVFHAFSGLDAGRIEAVSRRAELPFERVVESVAYPPPPEAGMGRLIRDLRPRTST